MSFRPVTDFEFECLKRGYRDFEWIEYLRDEVCSQGLPLENVLDLADMVSDLVRRKTPADPNYLTKLMAEYREGVPA